MNNNEIKIIKAELVDTYCIKLIFNDKTTQLIDFEPFLRSSRHPEIKKYLNKELFKQFKIIDGDLDWNDFDLAFPVADLYENSLMKKPHTEAA